MQWWDVFPVVAWWAGFNEGTSIAPSHQATSVSHTSHSSPADSEGEVQNNGALSRAAAQHRELCTSTKLTSNNPQQERRIFKTNRCVLPNKAFEKNHIPQLKLYLFFTYISYISHTYEVQELLLGFECRKREDSTWQHPHSPAYFKWEVYLPSIENNSCWEA